MLKIFKKIIFAASLILLYLIGKEFVQLYLYLEALNPYAGYGFLVLLTLFLGWFVVIPVINIIRIPKTRPPAADPEKKQDLLEYRINRFYKNKFLRKSGFDIESLKPDEESYNRAVSELTKEAEAIRKRYVSRLFYSTALSQNGFLDALFILSAGVNLTKEIFVLYNGRVSNKDLWEIAKRIYYSVAIGGSESVEYAAEEIFSKLASEGLKSIPFTDKIVSSVVDGFVNATLLTRTAMITENYCTKLHIKSNRELYPSARAITSATKSILGSVKDMIKVMLGMAVKEKKKKFFDKFKTPPDTDLQKIPEDKDIT